VKEFEDNFSIKTPSIRISKKYRDIFDDKLELYILAFAFDIQFIIDCPFEKTPAKKYFVQFENYKIVKHNFFHTNNDPDPKEFKAFLKVIISQYTFCTKYRFKNKKSKILSCNHTNIYKSNIKKLFDIDAFYGILQYQEATKSLRFGLDVELSNKKKINNRFFIQKDEKIINIKNLQHLYLCKFVLGKTIISVFLCFTRKRLFEEILKVITKYIENNKNKTVEHNIMFRSMNVENCLKFYLPNILISEFLLATVKRGFIFLESYGNKLDTCHEDIVLALKNIQNYFNLQEFTNFYIDFACTVLPVENVMIFPKNEFFKEYN
ncbi:hypothetical protein H312_03354, partial [Anncaliia algerae PRA339]